MGVQVGFMLQGLLAAAKRAGAKTEVVFNTLPDVYEEWEDQDTGEVRRVFVPGWRDDRVLVIMPDGRRFLFTNSFDTLEGIRFWFSNKNVNHEFRDLLDELKVPYSRS